MMKEERLQAIVRILEKQDFATVEELSSALGASMPTIRRDLNTLAGRNCLIRSRGGAMRLTTGERAVPAPYRKVSQLNAKLSIAREAAGLVRENSVIFLDSSAVAGYVTNYLKHLKNLIIVTNSLETASTLNGMKAKTYCLCGRINANGSAVGGYLAAESVGFFHINTFFFSACGMDSHGVIVETSEEELDLKSQLIENAECCVFLCDRSEFDKAAPYSLAPLSRVDYLITNGAVPAHYPKPKQAVILAK